MSETKPLLPTEAAERKKYPISSGVLDYFPAALFEVAKVSYIGNQQHNPGQSLHHARGKSTDHKDTAVRHIMEGIVSDDNNETFRLNLDKDNTYHLAKAAWRILSLLQEGLEKEGAPLALGARLPK